MDPIDAAFFIIKTAGWLVLILVAFTVFVNIAWLICKGVFWMLSEIGEAIVELFKGDEK